MITVVVNRTHDGIWNEETGHDGKPEFNQHASIYSVNILNTQTNIFLGVLMIVF